MLMQKKIAKLSLLKLVLDLSVLGYRKKLSGPVPFLDLGLGLVRVT